LVVCALAASSGCGGCSGCFAPPGAGENTPQGSRLKQLFASKEALTPEPAGDLPLKFRKLHIEEHTSGDKHAYQVWLGWSREGDDPLAPYLRRKLEASRKVDMAGGHLREGTLQIVYRFPDGTADTEDVTVPIDGKTTQVLLGNYCLKDVPTKADVKARSAVWVQPAVRAAFTNREAKRTNVASGKLTLQAPVELPIRFEDVILTPAKDAPAVGVPTLTWSLLNNDQTLLRSRLEPVVEKKAEAAGRELKQIEFAVSYYSQGKLSGTENLALDLTHNQGVVSLSKIPAGQKIDLVEILPDAVVWRERSWRVPLD
jgi:hypothetical protein